MEGTGRVLTRERCTSPLQLLLSPPLSSSPNPLAAGRTAEGRREEKRRSRPEGGARRGACGQESHDDHAEPEDQTDPER